MGCSGCALKTSRLKSCGNGGASCGCNRMSVYNWLADVPDVILNDYIPMEVSFKQGARKSYYRMAANLAAQTGDVVVVQGEVGFDIGRVSLSGELVNLQLKKKRINTPLVELPKVLRVANAIDLGKLKEARNLENKTMVRSRAIARELGLEMKFADVEFQGNGRKATFYYTAEDRIDFRELIRKLASEFNVRIEMRQIGMRQESARLGGIGSCGRELCCSSWLTDFSSVNTSAARYQNLSINQDKLSGQCGRLKCCLNYELDTYIEAFKEFPTKADRIETKEGRAFLVKTIILKRIMIYRYSNKNQFYKISVKDVKKMLEMNAQNRKPQSLLQLSIKEKINNDLIEDDLVGHISLTSLKQKKKNK